MLIAYIDEFGHDGAFIDPKHPKFHQHPAFGYSGFIIPASASRDLGAIFKRERNLLFKTQVESSPNPNQWEKKGNEYFSTGSIQKFPEYVRVFRSLIFQLRRLDGRLFYYGDEKLCGTSKQTGRDMKMNRTDALRETINRICRHADKQNQDVLIIADSITDKTRIEISADMYSHVYSRTYKYPEMKRAIEVPLHVESRLNTSVQFADWISALISRSTHYQLVRDSEFGWASELFGNSVHGMFTTESKLHIQGGEDIHNFGIFEKVRPLFPKLGANTLGTLKPELAAFYDTLNKRK